MPLIVSLILLLTLALTGCYNTYQAPVDERGRFLDAGRTHRVNGGETLYAVAWMYDLDPGALARANNLREPYIIQPGQMLLVDLRNVPATAATTVAATTPAATGVAVQPAPISSTGITRQSLPGSTAPPTSTPLPPAVSSAPPVSAPVPSPAPAPATTEPTTATVNPPITTPPVTAPPVTPPPVVTPVVVPEPAPPVIAAPALDPNAPVVWAWPSSGPILARYSESGVDGKGIDFDGNKGDAVLAAADGEVVYAGGGLLRYGDLVILKHNERFLSAYAHNSTINVKEGERVARGQKIAELGSSGIDRNMLHFEIRLDGKPVDPAVYLPGR